MKKNKRTTKIINVLMTLAVLMCVYIIVSITSYASARQAEKPTVNSVAVQKPVERVTGVVQAMNDYRATKSLPALTLSAQLNDSAQAKAADMVTRDYWSHADPDGVMAWHLFEKAGYDYTAAGENLAKCYDGGAAVVTAWVNSPEHEKVMSDDYEDIGIGVQQKADGCDVVVAHFGSMK